VRGSRQQGRNMAARQPRFAILEKRVALGQVGVARTQAFDFPAFQAQPGLEVIFDMVVVPGLTIFRDRAAAGSWLFLRCIHGKFRARLAATPFWQVSRHSESQFADCLVFVPTCLQRGQKANGQLAGMSPADSEAGLRDTVSPPRKQFADLSDEQMQAIASELSGS